MRFQSRIERFIDQFLQDGVHEIDPECQTSDQRDSMHNTRMRGKTVMLQTNVLDQYKGTDCGQIIKQLHIILGKGHLAMCALIERTCAGGYNSGKPVQT